MARIHKIKKVPDVVRQVFENLYEGDEYEFDFYWYWRVSNWNAKNPKNDTKIYGCDVYRNGEYYSNFFQASLKACERHLADMKAGTFVIKMPKGESDIRVTAAR